MATQNQKTTGEIHSLRVLITDDSRGLASRGEIRVQSWDKKKRLLRALKLGGLCWAAAVASIIVPIAHFVLVPGFLLAGPVAAYFIFEQKDVVIGGQGICPRCQAPLPIARTSYRFPISDICTACQSSLKIMADPLN